MDYKKVVELMDAIEQWFLDNEVDIPAKLQAAMNHVYIDARDAIESGE